MDIFFHIIGIMGGLGGLSFIIFLLLKVSSQERKARQLNELYPGFEFHCGGKFDGITFTYPFVKIQIEKENILISYCGVNLLLFCKNTEVEITNNSFEYGIKIKHNIDNYPKEIILFTPYYKLLLEYINGNV
jgi:hypothetical protein